MLTFKEFLIQEKYSFKNTGNSNYLTLDNGEVLHYNLNTLSKGYIEVVYNKTVHKVNIDNSLISEIEKITGTKVDIDNQDTKKFLSYFPTSCDEK
jgi:hypothetical protein